MKESGESSLGEMLTERLRGKRLLLVLDNFEHLLAAARSVGRMLAACEGAKVLVTSRALLNLSVEYRFPVRPFAVQDSTLLPSLDALGRNDAVALFLQRAQAVEPDFGLTGENAGAVVAICQAMGGLPLAIGLAAARLRMFSPNALIERLEGRPTFLAGGPVDAPKRQRSLWETITWYYDLLSLAEQRLFARLAVFSGGCTLESAEEVCNADGDLGHDVVPGLASLIDASLIQPHGGSRFAMLQPIRRFARERLEESGEANELDRWHAEYFRNLAEDAGPELHGPDQAKWIERLEAEHDNLRAVLQWSLESGEVEMGLHIAGAVEQFSLLRGHWSEQRVWTERLLARGGDVPPLLRAEAIGRAGALADRQGDHRIAEERYMQSRALFRELGDRRGEAKMLNNLGSLAFSRGDRELAEEWTRASLELLREPGDEDAIVTVLLNLATLAFDQGDHELARAQIQRCLSLLRGLGDEEVAYAIGALGSMAHHQWQNYDVAATWWDQSRALYKKLGDQRGESMMLNNLGLLAHEQLDLGGAKAQLEASLALSQTIGDREGVARTKNNLAAVALDRGDVEGARALLEESLEDYRAMGDVLATASVASSLAKMEVEWDESV